jgi:hypothetical protein
MYAIKATVSAPMTALGWMGTSNMDRTKNRAVIPKLPPRVSEAARAEYLNRTYKNINRLAKPTNPAQLKA